ncbi:MAG: ribosome silencing factor [Eubacterium sp.]|nr:ribosome silencing factor [Eubacterium sp.]
MTSKEIAGIAYKAIDEKLGKDIKIIDISEISILADYLIIVNGTNISQVQAIVDNVEMRMAENGIVNKKIEGNRNSTWVLMDYGDVIVQVFMPDDRLFYDLESIWRDGKDVDAEEFVS